MKIILLIVPFLFCSCIMDPGGDDRLRIVNQTNDLISVYYHSDTVPEYPSINATQLYLRDSIRINDTVRLTAYDPKPWSYFFERSKNNKLNLFIYSMDSLKKYKDIDTLIRRKIYKKVEYSERQLEKLNWVIVVK
jgi:hypothetical protein